MCISSPYAILIRFTLSCQHSSAGCKSFRMSSVISQRSRLASLVTSNATKLPFPLLAQRSFQRIILVMRIQLFTCRNSACLVLCLPSLGHHCLSGLLPCAKVVAENHTCRSISLAVKHLPFDDPSFLAAPTRLLKFTVQEALVAFLWQGESLQSWFLMWTLTEISPQAYMTRDSGFNAPCPFQDIKRKPQ